MFRTILGVSLLIWSFSVSYAHEVSKQAKAFIISPKDGVTVTNPVKVKFGIKGYLIAPAGENIHKAGHYHLLVDLSNELDMDESIPRDNNHFHFDQGEIETELNLSPGKHTLQLVVGDEEHEPFEALISEKITITVTK